MDDNFDFARPVGAQLPLSLRFTVLSGPLPLRLSAGIDFKARFSADALLVCDGHRIARISLDTWECCVLKEFTDVMYLVDVNQATGEALMHSFQDGRRRYSVFNPTTRESNDIGFDTQFMVIKGFAQCEQERPGFLCMIFPNELRRVDATGNLLEKSAKFHEIGQVNGCCPNRDGALFATDTAIFIWRRGQKKANAVAGVASAKGVRDGIGWRARFNNLKAPIYSGGRFLAVRDRDPTSGEASRLARIDLATDEVRTIAAMSVESLDLDVMTCWQCSAVRGGWIFTVVKSSTTGDYLLLRANLLGADSHVSDAGKNWRGIDLSLPLTPVTFKLADDSKLYFDQRILTARSEYFKSMFTSGCRESVDNVVDLSSDAQVDRASLEDLLLFIASNDLKVLDKNPDRALKVWKLADMYQIQDLCVKLEDVLSQALSKQNVFMILSHMHLKGTATEKACWAFLEREGSQIICENEGLIAALIKNNPQLAQALMLWSANQGAKRRRLS